MTKTLAGLFGALVIIATLGYASQVEALKCERDCGGECEGGCEVNSISCSCTSVGGGCPGSVTCSEYGEQVSCQRSVSFKCEKSDDGLPDGPEAQGLTVLPQTEWAVLRYRTDGIHPLTSGHVELVLASQASYGSRAVEELLRSLEKARQLRVETRERWRQQGPSAPAPLASPLVEERLHFMIDPAGPCRSIGLLLSSSAPPVFGGGFFRVTATGHGDVTAVSPLYGENGTDVRALARWLRREGRLLPRTAVDGPVEAYVHLRAEEAGVSYIIGGGDLLP
jgi:hypothetical protein